MSRTFRRLTAVLILALLAGAGAVQASVHLMMRPSGSAVGSRAGKALMYSAITIQSISCEAPIPSLNMKYPSPPRLVKFVSARV